MRSHLKLATERLTVDDIAGLDLAQRTHLVVLSACRTALAVGDRMGEGVSIAEAFATAGVPTLVASLWDVDDEATAILMSRFYENLASGGGKGDTLEALRRAQLSVLRLERDGMRPYEDPIYWAAFELIGDFR